MTAGFLCGSCIAIRLIFANIFRVQYCRMSVSYARESRPKRKMPEHAYVYAQRRRTSGKRNGNMFICVMCLIYVSVFRTNLFSAWAPLEQTELAKTAYFLCSSSALIEAQQQQFKCSMAWQVIEPDYFYRRYTHWLLLDNRCSHIVKQMVGLLLPE